MSDEKPKTPKKAPRSTKHADDYDVGYGRPPESGKFKKGQGGWPKGKKRGPRQADQSVEAVLQRTVMITEDGVAKKTTARAALVTRVLRDALKGDHKATVAFLKIDDAYQARRRANGPPLEDEEAQASRRALTAKLIGALGLIEQLMDTGGLEFRADATAVAKGWLSEAMARQPSIKDKMRVRMEPAPKKPQGGNSDPTEGA